MTLLVLSGCSHTSVTHRELRGVPVLQIDCSGLTSSWEKCYAKVRQTCGAKGYQVLGKTDDIKEEPGDGFLGWSPGVASRTMFAKCKA